MNLQKSGIDTGKVNRLDFRPERSELDNIEQAPYRRDRDLRVRLLELYILFVGSVMVGAIVLNVLAKSKLEQDVVGADLALAGAIASEIDVYIDNGNIKISGLAPWLDLIGRDRSGQVLVIDEEENIVIRQGREVDDSSIWIGWQNRVIRSTRRGRSDSFTTNSPDNAEWIHSFVASPEAGWKVIVQRPFHGILTATEGFQQGLLLAVVIYLAGGIVFWLVLSNQLISPLERMEAFSGLVRWRGHVRPEEKLHLAQLSDRYDRVGSLSRSLIAMAQDIEDRFVQLSTLLETGRVVAASLDVSIVMDNILDQVQRLFLVELCAVVALDKRAGVFRVRASRGLSEQYVRRLWIIPSEPNSPSMRALRNKTPIQVSDTETDLAFAEFRQRSRAEGYRSMLAVPLFTHHAPPAVLLLFKSKPYRYSYSELELASSFANHASVAMENAALHALTDDRLQEQTRRLEAIVESLGDGLILESLDGEILYCNRQTSNLVGLSRGQTMRKQSSELLNILFETSNDPPATRAAFQTVLMGHGTREFDLERKDSENRPQDLRIHLFDVTDANGDLIGCGQLWQDITLYKELDRMKSSLLSVVSHELRTPLAAIKGYATTLLADDVQWDISTQHEFLQTISDETDRLTDLVKNLLDMSRIEAGTLQMSCDFYPLEALVNQAVRRVRPSFDSRLCLRLAQELPMVWVDASRIETVIRNLLENAVKYSPVDTPIELETHIQNCEVTLQIRDYGEGIPEQFHDKVFDRFFRVDSRLTRHNGGVGMGLSICKGFVEAHGGRIWVSDAHPGTIFGFSLPVKNANIQENSSR